MALLCTYADLSVCITHTLGATYARLHRYIADYRLMYLTVSDRLDFSMKRDGIRIPNLGADRSVEFQSVASIHEISYIIMTLGALALLVSLQLDIYATSSCVTSQICCQLSDAASAAPATNTHLHLTH
jgi:hypothetical protein